jgi:hypothetical protein
MLVGNSVYLASRQRPGVDGQAEKIRKISTITAEDPEIQPSWDGYCVKV